MYKPYPKMKDSGMPWIGEIPVGWEVRKLKYVSDVQFSSVDKLTKVDELPVRLCNYTDVYNNDLITEDIEFMNASATKEEISKYALLEGDILITKDSESWDDIAVPSYVAADLDNVICGYHLARIRPFNGKVIGRFLHRSFIANGICDQFKISANGVTRFGIGKLSISNALFLLPPLPEQRAIAAFLDRETSRIDALIDRKERLIALLKEKRQALITRAVTKGLDPNATMKDSGVPWIGEIPAGWEVRKLKHAIKNRLMYGANESAEFDDVSFPRYIRITDFTEGGKLRDDTFKSLPPDIAHDYILSEGDILFARSGATVGKTFQFKDYDGKACFAGYLIKASPDTKHILSDYLYHYTRSFFYEEWRNSIFIQATIQNIGAEKYQQLSVVVPPIPEQRAIVAFLDRETSRSDAIIDKITDQITKLRELRQTLISHAVTGKIDVRGEVAAAEMEEAPA